MIVAREKLERSGEKIGEIDGREVWYAVLEEAPDIYVYGRDGRKDDMARLLPGLARALLSMDRPAHVKTLNMAGEARVLLSGRAETWVPDKMVLVEVNEPEIEMDAALCMERIDKTGGWRLVARRGVDRHEPHVREAVWLMQILTRALRGRMDGRHIPSAYRIGYIGPAAAALLEAYERSRVERMAEEARTKAKGAMKAKARSIIDSELPDKLTDKSNRI